MKTRLLIIAAALGLWACEGKVAVGGDSPELIEPKPEQSPQPDPNGPTLVEPEVEEPTTEPTPSTTPEPEIVYEVPEFTPDQILGYMRSVSQLLVSRPLTSEESNTISAQGTAAIEPMVRAWAQEPAFAENAKYMMQQKLKASGERDGIDFDLPGNLVAHVVRNNLPWSTILTADYCIDGAGSQTPCDSGAPFVAGVLSTRAYLAGNASRFNLGRANRMMNVFACRIYPMEAELQPYLEKSELIAMFQANSAEEQTVEEAQGGFGNGAGCYTCHGQFGAHAQLFVKFDESGMYQAGATGLQDPEGELGRSLNGLMTSHFNDPTRAADEGSQLFGQQVTNLADAARVLASSEPFLPCQAKAVLQHTFGLGESAEIDRDMLKAIAAKAREINSDPTYADLAVATFTEPRVILSVVGGNAEGGTP